MPRLLALLPLALLMASSAAGQAFTVTYTFTGAAGNETTLPPDNDPSGVTPSDIARGPGLGPAAAGNTFSSNGYNASGTLSEALASGDYFEFTLAPENGFTFSLASLDFGTQRSSTGPQNGELRASVDGYAAAIGGPIAHPTALAGVGPFDLSGAAFQHRTAPVTFRLYGYGASSVNGTLRIDNLALSGTATSASGQSVTLSLTNGSAALVEGASTTAPNTPTVTVTTSDGSAVVTAASAKLLFATAGSTGQAADVAGLPLIVTVPAGTASGATVTQPVTAFDDGQVEGSETVNLVLGNASGASIAGGSGTFTLTIADPNVQVVTVSLVPPASATITEGDATVVTFRATTSDGQPIGTARTVDFDLVATATSTVQDFTGFTDPTRLSFPAGTASGATTTLTLQSFDDTAFEGTETFRFTLVNPSAHTAAGDPALYTLTINDNDVLGQTVVCPGLTGAPLRACIRTNYTPTSVYSYDVARDTLFAYVDDGDRTRITDLYVGRTLPLRPGFDPTQEGCNGDKDSNTSTCSGSRTINTEHVFPQSMGAATGRAQADLHHLYPARGDVNSVRSNHPYGEFPYRTATGLYRDTLTYTFATLPVQADTLTFSAYRSGVFMPRASVRGDVARATFYFRAIYEAEATAAGGLAFFEGMKATLLRWNSNDPATGADVARSTRVKQYQGTDNPFVLDTTLARRAYDDGQGATGVAADAVAAALHVYPSPARDRVRAAGFEGEAVVVDVLGRRVARLQAGETLQVGTWPRGLYALRAGSRTAVFLLVE